MVFNNVLFLFGFLPVTWLLVQRLKNPKAKNIALLAASLLFYAFGSWKDLGVLLILGTWTYVSALEMEADPQNRKPVFIASVAVEIAVLCFYKYIPYWFSDLKIGFPIGISFYTFSAISYLADIYMKKAPLQTDPVAFGLYLAFFGKVNMGPISEYHQMENQLSRRVCTHKKTGEGLLLFTRGLVKKVVFADQLAVAYTLLRADDSWLGAWLLTLVYTFQLYFDKSGYSSLHRQKRQGVLAPLAHRLVDVVSRLRVHSSWRKPRRETELHPQYPDRLAPYRNLARPQPNLRRLGIVLWRSAAARAFRAPEAF